jgi:hypothetical protein
MISAKAHRFCQGIQVDSVEGEQVIAGKASEGGHDCTWLVYAQQYSALRCHCWVTWGRLWSSSNSDARIVAPWTVQG